MKRQWKTQALNKHRRFLLAEGEKEKEKGTRRRRGYRVSNKMDTNGFSGRMCHLNRTFLLAPTTPLH